MTEAAGCNNCNKGSLSLLFLRPSPVVKTGPLVAKGSKEVVSDAGVMAGLLPSVLPTQSRFALRLLRAGYVHIYIDKPPVGVKNWLVYRVTEQADLLSQNNQLFSALEADTTCKRAGHNEMGYKLVNIPQAHLISDIWVAFSANLWNEKLRADNKANASVMQKVSLKSGGPNSFIPNAANLRVKVLECALGKLSVGGSEEHDFPFISVSSEVEELAENMKRAAAAHPKTAGKEVAVVLRDPVGIATELNAIRVRRNELVRLEFSKPENAHPLNSSSAILGLRQTLVSAEDAESYNKVSPLRLHEQFIKEKWPEGTEWQPLSEEDRTKLLVPFACSEGIIGKLKLPYKKAFERSDMGRVIYPDKSRRAAAWTKENVEKNWASMKRYYDEEERSAWISNFHKRMKKEHYDPMLQFETDWRAAADDAHVLKYFKNHFDPEQEYTRLMAHNPFLTYSKEMHWINTPAPYTEGPLLVKYVENLLKEIDGEASSAWKGIVANRGDLLRNVHLQLVGDPGSDGMRDKVYDFGKGVTELKLSEAAMTQHGWIGNALMMFSFGQYTAISAAVATVAAGKLASTIDMQATVGKIAKIGMVHRFMESAVQGTLKISGPKMPLVITLPVAISEAIEIFDRRVSVGQDLGITKSKIKANTGGGKRITITVITDTDAFKAAGGNLSTIAHNPNSGIVKIGGKASRQTAIDTAGTATLLRSETILKLYRENANINARAAGLIRKNIVETTAVLKTAEARLALGGMIIQTIGIWNARKAASEAKTDEALVDAYIGMLDSAVGFSAGALQLATLAAEVAIMNSAGHAAAATSIKLGLLRSIGAATGIAGGMISYYVSIKKYAAEDEAHNYTASRLYRLSAISFGLTGLTSAGMTVGAVASTLEARAIGGTIARSLATRLAANAAIATVGGVAITVSGVGLVLLGAGIVFQVGAIVLTPTKVQRWLGRSYFGRDGGLIFSGKRDDMFAKGDWLAEKTELEAIFKESEEAKSHAREACA